MPKCSNACVAHSRTACTTIPNLTILAMTTPAAQMHPEAANASLKTKPIPLNPNARINHDSYPYGNPSIPK